MRRSLRRQVRHRAQLSRVLQDQPRQPDCRPRRPGIFISGAFQGPLDIPESVVTASARGCAVRRAARSPGGGSWPGTGCIRRKGMSRKRRPGSASSCVVAAPISDEWSTCLRGRVLPDAGATSFTPRRACSSARPNAAQAISRHDPGEGAQSRGRRRLHPEDA